MIIILCIAVFAAGIFGLIYNRLVRLKFLVKEAWSDIDVQLKKRHDLIPNIVDAVKGYKEYEQKVLTDVTALRTKAENITGAIKDKSRAENDFSAGLRNIFAVAEAYPDLKSNRSFLDLQKTLVEIEDSLQMARRYYNGTVRNFNTAIETFPSSLIAAAFNFKPVEFFEIEYATQRQVPDVKM